MWQRSDRRPYRNWRPWYGVRHKWWGCWVLECRENGFGCDEFAFFSRFLFFFPSVYIRHLVPHHDTIVTTHKQNEELDYMQTPINTNFHDFITHLQTLINDPPAATSYANSYLAVHTGNFPIVEGNVAHFVRQERPGIITGV